MGSDHQPNVIVAFTDQMRASAMGCAGNDDVITPNLDRLAEEGTRSERAYANYPLCGPSRACLLTGQYPLTHTVIDNDLPLPTTVPSIAATFNRNGYTTGYIGKWHLDGVPRDKWTPPGPRRQGFDDFWAAYNCSHDYFNAKYYRNSPEPVEISEYEPIAQTDLAIDFVRDAEEPFCLFLSWGPPHDPYRMVPERYRKRYDDVSLRENAEPLMPEHETHPARANLNAPPVREWEGDVYETAKSYDYAHQRDGLADYYAAITAIDEQMGRLMDVIEEREIFEETILTFTSDHGDMLWSHGKNQKGMPYEESINVPFFVRWPGQIPSGVVDDTLLGTVDVAPTLLDLAGITPPDSMEGRSLEDVLRGNEPRSVQEPVFLMNIRRRWRGLRTPRYTYVRVSEDDSTFDHFPHGNSWLLFDNDNDPFQFNNVVLDATYQDVREDLDKMVDEWLDELDDPFVSLEEHIRDLSIADEWNERERQRNTDRPRLIE